ncbi:hypothetical protein JXQ70_16720 [bacterium]|nr:hypothetical protein [bacterium]
MFRKVIETSTFIHSFHYDHELVLLTGNSLQIHNSRNYQKEKETKLFEKDGLNRDFIADQYNFYIKDFISLLIVERKTLEIITKIRLGTDLKNDICALTQDGDNIYISIRNGDLVSIEKNNFERITTNKVAETSIWDMAVHNRKLIAGTVRGSLLVIEPRNLEVEKEVPAHKKNTKGIYIIDNYMLTAGQDLVLHVWDLEKFEIVETLKKTHSKAFTLVGTTEDRILTVSYACGEIKVWHRSTLKHEKTIPIQKCLTGKAIIAGNTLYMTSRALSGLEKTFLSEL